MRAKKQVLLMAFLAVTANSLVMAGDSVTVMSETVRYDDLRLISNVGASVLYARLRSAAERVCGGPAQTAQITEQHRYKTCVDDALAKAVADVNHPVLTQYASIRKNSPVAPTPTATAAATPATDSVSVVAKAR